MPWVQLGSFGVLTFGVLWMLIKGMPMLLNHMSASTQLFLDAQRESREYHRADVDAMRLFMREELIEHRNSVAGLARAIERNTIAQIAAHKGEDPAQAVDRYTNGHDA